MLKARELYFFEPLLCFPIHLLFPPSQLLLSYQEVLLSIPFLLLWVLPIHLHWEAIHLCLGFQHSNTGCHLGRMAEVSVWRPAGEWCLINQVPSHFVQSICLCLIIIADAFNTFFFANYWNLNLHQEERGDVICFLKHAFPRKFPGI
jgi:hypothetical protein